MSRALTPAPNPRLKRWLANLLRPPLLLGLAALPACQRPSPWDLPAVEPAHTLGPTPLQQHRPTPEAVRFDLPEPTPDLPPELPPAGTLDLTLEQAVFAAIRNNRALQIQQLEPVIAGTFEEIERAVYDPAVFVDATLSRDRVQETSRATGTAFSVEGQQSFVDAGITQQLPTGTQIELGVSHDRGYSNRTPDQHEVRGFLTLTQALLQGAGPQANLARIQQANLDTLASLAQLRGFASALVADVEDTYWQLALAQRRIEIFEHSLGLAEDQQRIAEQRIAVGVLPETELAAARAEVARRRQDLIDARSLLDQTRLRLLQLINPRSRDGWSRVIETLTSPRLPEEVVLEPVEAHVALGLRLRPELREAQLQLERNRLEVVQTRSGLLPRLDLFITLGKSGFADAFGPATRDIDGQSYDLAAGLRFDYPLGNRAAEALQTRALVSRYQAAESLENLAQLIELDVRTAYLEVQRAQQQIAASAATRALQEEVLRAESVKFDVGESTAVLVAQAQRDLLESQIAEVEAVIAYRRALVSLYRLEGSLLQRRGIDTAWEKEGPSGRVAK